MAALIVQWVIITLKSCFDISDCLVFSSLPTGISAPLSNCTKEEMWAVIRFLHSVAMKTAEIAECNSSMVTVAWVAVRSMCGLNTLKIVEFCMWQRVFSIPPPRQKPTLKQLNKWFERIVLSTTDTLNISHGSAFSIVHESLNFQKKSVLVGFQTGSTEADRNTQTGTSGIFSKALEMLWD